jgi:hypothetical protein
LRALPSAHTTARVTRWKLDVFRLRRKLGVLRLARHLKIAEIDELALFWKKLKALQVMRLLRRS